jgi:hypothetical protein
MAKATTSEFVPLTPILADWFDKPTDALPSEVRKSLSRYPLLAIIWGSATPQQRREAAADWDYQRNPDTQQEQEQYLSIWSEIRELERVPASVPTEIESKKRQLAALRCELDQLEERARGREQHAVPADRLKSAVPSEEIITHFRVKADEHQNRAWWRVRMRDAKRYKLDGCRVSPGRGKNRPALWHPGDVAAWICDKHPDVRRVAITALRTRFSGFDDIADMLSG